MLAADKTVPTVAPGHRKLLDECREIVVLRLAEVIHEALDKMSDHLADEAVQCGGTEQRQALLEALSVVREHRIEIESRFRRSFADVFERRMSAEPATAPDASAGEPAELSLVSDVEIDERIEVERLAHRARGHLDPDEVLGIRARLGALVEREWFDENAHPASPQAVFEALKAALAEVAPRQEVKSALLDAFEPHVSAGLNNIYARVNQRLVAGRILPRIRLVAQAQASGVPGAGGAAGTTGLHGAGATDAVAAGLGAAELAGAGFGAIGRPGGVPPEQAGAALEAMLQRLVQGQQSARLSAARMLSDPGMFGVVDLPLPAPGAPLLDALSSLQAHPTLHAGDGGAGESLSYADLFHLLAEQAREQGSPLDQLTVEIVSIVFDYIQGDKRLPDPVKHQLMRMQVVAVKAALIDRSFFARRQHPMRRVIDRIAEIGADPDAETAPDSPLLVGLTRIVDRVVAEFDRDLAVFEQALARIEQLVQEESGRRAHWLAERTEQAERQDRLAVARDEAGAQVALRLDAAAPAFVRDFLQRHWIEVLARCRCDDADRPVQTWDEALRVVEDLLWSVAPKAPGEVVQLAQLLPKLIQALMRGLKRLELPDDERQVFFDALLSAHTQAIAAAKAGPAVARRDAAGAAAAAQALRPGQAGEFPGAPPGLPDAAARLAEPVPSATDLTEPAGQGADLSLLDALGRGDRIELAGDDDGAPQRYKLAWISPSRKLFVLSRYPKEARSLAAEEFAAMFEQARARVVPPEESVLDRAIGAVSRDEAALA